MIKFFRSIRQKLLSENRFSKYLIYAVGEIVLVVIGILIALQINNWNEGQKSKQLELEMLREIGVGLNSDLDDINLNLSIHNNVLNSQNIIIDWLENDHLFHDTLSQHFANVSNGSVFLANEGPYETLKQLGIRLISNDTLRDQILKTYDFTFQDYSDHTKIYYDLQLPFFQSINARNFKSTDVFNGMQPKNVDKIKADEAYAYQVRTIRNYNEYFINRKINPAINEAKKTIEMIKWELKANK